MAVPKWLQSPMRKPPVGPVVMVVLGVTMTGPLRHFSVLHTYTLKASHVAADTPLTIGALEALGFDYIMVVREALALKEGWIK